MCVAKTEARCIACSQSFPAPLHMQFSQQVGDASLLCLLWPWARDLFDKWNMRGSDGRPVPCRGCRRHCVSLLTCWGFYSEDHMTQTVAALPEPGSPGEKHVCRPS